MTKIAIGSRNPIKVEAVKSAFEKVFGFQKMVDDYEKIYYQLVNKK